jgi:hypothetical protein
MIVVNLRTKINNCLGKQGGCLGSSFVRIKLATVERESKTITGFGFGHSLTSVPNVASTCETGSPRCIRYSKYIGGYFTVVNFN